MSTADDMLINTLAPWFGTNRTLAPAVGEELRGQAWVGVVFAGAMTELPYITARTLLVNDLHGDIIRLARVVGDEHLGPALYRRLRRRTFHPRELADAQRRVLERRITTGSLFGAPAETEADPGSDLEQAEDYFISVWMGRSAEAGTDSELRGNLSVRWGATGGDSATRFHNAVASLPAWRRVLKRCSFSELDCFEFIDSAVRAKNAQKESRALYLDPPFPDAGEAYVHKFTEADQRRLAKRCAAITTHRVVIRFYDHPLIRDIYPEGSRWTWRRMTGRDQANGEKPEVLIINGESYGEVQ